LIVGFSAPKPVEPEKGILVNFGTDETGSGLIEPSPPQSREETTQVPPDKSTAQPENKNALLTQNVDKETPAVKKVDSLEIKKRKEQSETERIKREELKAEKIKKTAEDAEKKKVEAEQKRASDIQNRTKNALANSKNSGTNSTSEGNTGGSGNQGDPNGSVDSKVRGTGSGTGTSGSNVSYDLQGRGFRLLPTPRYDYQGEGTVVVEVSVDRSGKVTKAVPGGKGSTALDEYLLSVAKEAAMKATFDPKPTAPLIQTGTITYKFILK
jgi:TonB family protein